MSLGLVGRCPRISVVRICPKGYPHAQAFAEVIRALTASLVELGAVVTIRDNQVAVGELNILLGAHLMTPEAVSSLPAEVVIYNLEQICGAAMLKESQLAAYRGRVIWDYSMKNLLTWSRHGVHDGLWVPVGFQQALSSIESAAHQDIDVLFYGSLNERRRRILDDLARGGVKVEAVFGTYGAERDALIARAKVVLNLHAYPVEIFEMVRVVYLLANRKAVVAEIAEGTEISPIIRRGTCLAPYDDLVATCLGLVGDDGRRAALEQMGYRAVKSLSLAATLAAVLPQTVYLLEQRGVRLSAPTQDCPVA